VEDLHHGVPRRGLREKYGHIVWDGLQQEDKPRQLRHDVCKARGVHCEIVREGLVPHHLLMAYVFVCGCADK
jgi:hypothetical protein